jgi:hypothetical protein
MVATTKCILASCCVNNDEQGKENAAEKTGQDVE